MCDTDVTRRTCLGFNAFVFCIVYRSTPEYSGVFMELYTLAKLTCVASAPFLPRIDFIWFHFQKYHDWENAVKIQKWICKTKIAIILSQNQFRP